MDGASPRIDFNELLSHAEWVRAVARRLVDGSSVDDAVQDTWVEALERPPSHRRNLRAWLGAVVTNRVRQTGRGELRRQRRERGHARPEAQPSMEDLAERASLQRDVVGHVLALDEPFRSVILLRFFEDLTPPEIAERLEVPLKTVHSRMQRAFDKLRARMENEYGRDRWCLALAPLLHGLPGREVAPAAMGAGTAATAGVWIVKAKIGIALAIAVTGGVAWWTTTLEQPQASAVSPEAEVALSPGPSPASPSVASGTLPRASEREAFTPEVPAEAPTPEVEKVPDGTFLVRGRAVDMAGAPLAGLGIAVGEEADAAAETDAAGMFEVSLEDGAGSVSTRDACLTVVDESWVTVRQSCVGRTNREMEHLVVAARTQRVEGRVEDEDGAPIEGATVRLSPQGDAFIGFPYALDLTQAVMPRAETDGGGRFVLDRLAKAPGLRLHVFADGYEGTGVDLDDAAWPLVVRLVRPEAAAQAVLEGTVLDHRGFLVEGARVRLADAEAKTDAAGLFRIPVGYVDESTPLCAAKEGALPAIIPDFGERLASQGEQPEPVELVLGPTPVEIHGRVVDETGEPCAGWKVSVVNATAITQFRVPVDTAEGFARGAEPEDETGTDGSFALSGLFPREYLVQAYDRDTLLRGEAKLEGGDRGAVVRVERALRRDVEGVVVDRRGNPVPGVEVRVALDVVKVAWGSSSISGPRVLTDEDGRFGFDAIPAHHAYLAYQAEHVMPGRFEPAEGQESGSWTVPVSRRCHFRVELAGELAAATWARLYDADGGWLQVNQFQAGGMSGFGRARLEGGRSEVYSVAETAAVITFGDGEEELGRREIALESGDVNLLRF